jgi:hypothetical protein
MAARRGRGPRADTATSLAIGSIGIGVDAGPTTRVTDLRPTPSRQIGRRLARTLELERVYDPDRDAMVAALRVVLDLPRQLPDRGQGGVR